MPLIKFKLNQTYHSGTDVICVFQDGCHGSHLGYRNRTILAVLYLHAAPMPSTEFPLSLTVQQQITIKDFQDGHHGYHHGYDSDGDVENVKRY